MKKKNNKILYLLGTFLFLTPFEYPMADLFFISPLRIVGLLVILIVNLDVVKQKKIKIDYRFWGIILWLSYDLVTVFWTPNIKNFSKFFMIYLNNGIMFLLISLISFTEIEIKKIKKYVVYGVWALLLYMTFIPNAVIYSNYQHRLTLNAGVGGLDQNYLAALMIMAFGISFYELCNRSQKNIEKLKSIIFCLWIFYYIILTGSRSGIIAIMVIILLSINFSLKIFILIGIPLLLVVVMILPKIMLYFSPELLERFTISALRGQEGESGTRLLIWSKALESIENYKIIFGHGIGSSQIIIGDILGIGKDMAIHNHYITMIVEIGIIGFILINYSIFKMIKSQWKENKDIAISFLGIAIIAVFIDVLTTKFFWSAMIVLSISCSKKRLKI